MLVLRFVNSVSYLDSYNDAEKSMENDLNSDIEGQEGNSPKRRRIATKHHGYIPFESELELNSDVPVQTPSAILSRALTKKTPSQESAVSHASQTPQTDQPPIAASPGAPSWNSSNQETVSPAALVIRPVHPSVEVTERQVIQSRPENSLPKYLHFDPCCYNDFIVSFWQV